MLLVYGSECVHTPLMLTLTLVKFTECAAETISQAYSRVQTSTHALSGNLSQFFECKKDIEDIME